MNLKFFSKSISKQISLIISIALILILGLSLGTICIISEKNSISEKETSLHEFNTVTLESIIFAMSEGATDIQPLIERARKIPNIKEFRVIPTALINGKAASTMDAIEKTSVKNNQSSFFMETFNYEEVFRSVVPIISDKGCIKCHDGNIGDAMAVVSIRYSMDSTYANLSNQRLLSTIIILLSVVVFMTIIIFAFKKILLQDLFKAINVIKKLALGDMSSELEYRREDEIGDLMHAVNILKENFSEQAHTVAQLSEGDFDVEVKTLSDQDKLGKSIIEIQNSLKLLSGDIKLLSVAAYNGELSTRVDETKHNGTYNKIVKGFNSAFDHLTAPINEGAKILGKMSQGDLSVRMTGNYNGDHEIIKKSINHLADSFETIIKQVKDSVELTKSSALQISSSSEEMAAGAQQQSSQTEEVASAIEQMSKTALETASNSSIASNAARDAGEYAQTGVNKIIEAKKGMQEIVSSTNITGNVIASLALQTEQIGAIAQVIDDIADQTNLLALNAAIEAARAGEQGRGFAVVADEVRKLAERTTKATKEIAQTIKSVQSEANKADNSMKDARDVIERGIIFNNELETALTNILQSSKSAIEQINQVASAIEEQSTTSEQISQNVTSINMVTNENANGISQIVLAAEDLNSLTSNLYEIVNKFKVVEDKTVKDNKYFNVGKN